MCIGMAYDNDNSTTYSVEYVGDRDQESATVSSHEIMETGQWVMKLWGLDKMIHEIMGTGQ